VSFEKENGSRTQLTAHIKISSYLISCSRMTKVINNMMEKSHTVPMMAKSLRLMLNVKDNPSKET
jgi:hypothetical protein